MESVLKMTKPINDYYGFDAWHGLGDRGGLTISKAIQLVPQAKGDERNLVALPPSCDEELV
jgi:hypothetical protein